MSALARADLERLLHARKLGTTLPPAGGLAARDERLVAATGMGRLDQELLGGWPRGQVSEIVGPLSAGASWVASVSLASATRRGELSALIDPLDMFDPESAATAGFLWPSLLWIRGVPSAQPRRTSLGVWAMVLDRALKALALVLQAQGFGLVVLDLQGVPACAVGALPFTTWRRVSRLVEGRDTACLVLYDAALARSSGGVTLALDAAREGPRGLWTGDSPRSCHLTGLDARGRLVGAHWPHDRSVRLQADVMDMTIVASAFRRTSDRPV